MPTSQAQAAKAGLQPVMQGLRKGQAANKEGWENRGEGVARLGCARSSFSGQESRGKATPCSCSRRSRSRRPCSCSLSWWLHMSPSVRQPASAVRALYSCAHAMQPDQAPLPALPSPCSRQRVLHNGKHAVTQPSGAATMAGMIRFLHDLMTGWHSVHSLPFLCVAAHALCMRSIKGRP